MFYYWLKILVLSASVVDLVTCGVPCCTTSVKEDFGTELTASSHFIFRISVSQSTFGADLTRSSSFLRTCMSWITPERSICLHDRGGKLAKFFATKAG